jgi:hypothetical protein
MMKRLRIILRTLLPKREAEIIVRLSRVRVIADSLFEHGLGLGKFPAVHEFDTSVVSFES